MSLTYETNPNEIITFGTETRTEPHPIETEEKQSQASILVAYAIERFILFHNQNGEIFAKSNKTHETQRLESSQFRDWLVSGYYAAFQQSPRDAAVREALSTLKSLGRYHAKRYNAEQHEVHIRVAKHEAAPHDTYYLDLGEPNQSNAVKIQAGEWMLVENPPVNFIRPNTLCALPKPEHGGEIDLLWKIVNIPENSRILKPHSLCSNSLANKAVQNQLRKQHYACLLTLIHATYVQRRKT
jgi:hypothetical protein